MGERRTLVTLPSGTIDLAFNEFYVSIEFNVEDCRDALPFCHAMCCRVFTIGVDKEDAEKWRTRPHPITKQPILMKNEKGACTYLQKDCLCGTHPDKPAMCHRFHCSPKGALNDPNIERRDAGWLLNHVRKEEAELVQIELGE